MLIANFWESLLKSDLQRPVDPGDPSMPYGPPLWSMPQQHLAEMRGYNSGSYDPIPSERWFAQQQLRPDSPRMDQLVGVPGSSSPVQMDIDATADAQSEPLKPTFAIFSNSGAGSFDDLAHQVNDDQPPLKRLHPESTYQSDQTAKGALEYWRKQTTPQIIDSLRPGTKGSLQVSPDGTIGNGNTRIMILQERGFDVNSLPRDVWNPNIGGGRSGGGRGGGGGFGGGGKGGGGGGGGWRWWNWM